MNEFEIAELLNNLNNRFEEIEDRFKIKNSKDDDNCNDLWVENIKLALGVDDKEKKRNDK